MISPAIRQMGIYVYRNNQVEGPFDELVIQQALANGTMSAADQCCLEGREDWASAAVLFPPRIHQKSSQFKWWLLVGGLTIAGFVVFVCILAVVFSNSGQKNIQPIPVYNVRDESIRTRMAEIDREGENLTKGIEQIQQQAEDYSQQYVHSVDAPNHPSYSEYQAQLAAYATLCAVMTDKRNKLVIEYQDLKRQIER